eukprot:TRINITY_DN55572_c0_g1_i1.p1 TRINITY_DN55572_c0_g1~~TRINITY_DN55572_c0_g1_i1.p1  ORF type:complete len:107 (+),score=35.45 TRINITY_DN55572_c0_g1_i1:97-417(+)
MSWSIETPTNPSLFPRTCDPLWFGVDKPVDEESLLAKEEAEHAQVMAKIAKRGADITPIGKSSAEAIQEPDEEEDEDEDSESEQEDEDEEDVDIANNFNQEDNNQN